MVTAAGFGVRAKATYSNGGHRKGPPSAFADDGSASRNRLTASTSPATAATWMPAVANDGSRDRSSVAADVFSRPPDEPSGRHASRRNSSAGSDDGATSSGKRASSADA